MSDQTSQDARAVLVDKARRHAQQCAEILAQHQQRLARLLSSADRVTTMLDGYQHRLAEEQRRPRPMADTRNERLFLHNLRVMADKLSTDVQSARALRDAAARTLGEAERSVLQARKLLEIAQQARRAEQQRRDQAELDGWSTMRHAWSAHKPTPSER